MKSLICVLIWSMLFTSLGIYTNNEVSKFTEKYTSNIKIIETYIEEDKWNEAKEELYDYSKRYYEEKSVWYKLLNHTYFDNICLYLSILDKSIYTKDKTKSFEEIENIKSTLDSILETEKFDINHIL